MKKFPLTVKKRENPGKKSAKSYRAEGLIPAVLYGLDIENQLLAVPKIELDNLLKGVGSEHALLGLKIGTRSRQEVLAVIKEIQHAPVDESIQHVDFEHISPKRPITIEVGLEFEGEAVGQKQGGIVTGHLWEIPVKGLIQDIPDIIKVNITDLEIDQSIHIKDLKVEGFEILVDPDRTVVTISSPKKITVEEKAEEEVEEAEEIGEEAAIKKESKE
ncbi:50S ribosomal protein L25 [bacterium]|nr:50S ribosomal protein L25 [bacterium]